MENTGSAAQGHRLGQLITEAQSWIEIVVIADVGLRFIARAERQCECLRRLPVGLHETSQFKLVEVQNRIASVYRKRRRPACRVGAETRIVFRIRRIWCAAKQAGICKRSKEVVFRTGAVHSIGPLDPRLHRPFRARIHQEIAELRTPVIVCRPVLCASREK